MNDIAVLIPYYNDPEGISRTVRSIQEEISIDIIIVDDGSSLLPNWDEIAQYASHHTIKTISLEKNEGIEHALNAGLKYIISKGYMFTARLDAGDIVVQHRFIKQRDYLMQHPIVCLVGTWGRLVDCSGKALGIRKYPTEHKDIERYMYFFSGFMHPSVMFRTLAVEQVGMYPTQYKYCEDYAFFFKFIKYFKTANLPEVLMEYEINPRGISQSKYRIGQFNSIRVIMHNFRWRFVHLFCLSLARRIICLILGAKIATWIALRLGGKNNSDIIS
ncbi:MAG: glycosyltransferase [Spirochaetes bacterium]|nr:glycosyltransferase [Spirochaetota bacterium]